MITELVEHNRRSVLRSKLGKEHSKDLVGEVVRNQIEENISKFDPFNKERVVHQIYFDKSKGGPFVGLAESDLERFLVRKRKEYNFKYSR